MEVDALYSPDDYYDDLELGCECVALHKGGFRGPCFFCQRQGHMQRTCPWQVFPEYRLPNPATSGGTTEVDTGQQPNRAGRNTIGHGEDKIEAREGKTAMKSGESGEPKPSQKGPLTARREPGARGGGCTSWVTPRRWR